jgi:hypothetical protein
VSASLEDLLGNYSPEVRDLARRVRALVLDVAPGLREQVDLPASLLGYSVGPKMVDTVCTIMPLKAGVNLGIYRGAELPDPERLLTGTGKVHRHVRLSSTADVDRPAVRQLLEAVVAAKRAQ